MGTLLTITLAGAAALAVLAFTVVAGERPSAAAQAAGAAPARLYLTVPSGPVAAGESVTVQVRLHSDSEPVNAVQADVTYSGHGLDVDSVTVNDTLWGVTALAEGGGGNASVQVGTTTPVIGDTLLATITLTASEPVTPTLKVADTSVALGTTNDDRNLLLADPPPDSKPPDSGDPGPDRAGPGGDLGDPPGVEEPLSALVHRTRWRGRALRVRLECPEQAPSHCQVRLRVVRSAGRRVGGPVDVKLPAGKKKTVAVKLPAGAARRVKRHPGVYRLDVRTVTSAGRVRGEIHVPGRR